MHGAFRPRELNKRMALGRKWSWWLKETFSVSQYNFNLSEMLTIQSLEKCPPHSAVILKHITRFIFHIALIFSKIIIYPHILHFYFMSPTIIRLAKSRTRLSKTHTHTHTHTHTIIKLQKGHFSIIFTTVSSTPYIIFTQKIFIENCWLF